MSFIIDILDHPWKHKKKKKLNMIFFLLFLLVFWSYMSYVYPWSDGSGDEEIPLTVQIWDSNRFADDLLGEVTLSILDFMEMEDTVKSLFFSFSRNSIQKNYFPIGSRICLIFLIYFWTNLIEKLWLFVRSITACWIRIDLWIGGP